MNPAVAAAIAAAFRGHTTKSASILGLYIAKSGPGRMQLVLRDAVTDARVHLVAFPAEDAQVIVTAALQALAAERAALAARAAERRSNGRKALHRTAAA